MIQVNKKLIQELKDTGLLFISGSYARREERPDSDIDFGVKEDRRNRNGDFCELKNIRKIIEVLNRNGVEWSSHFVDTIYTTNTDIQLEFADIFPRYRKGKREIMGVEFDS